METVEVMGARESLARAESRGKKLQDRLGSAAEMALRFLADCCNDSES